MKRTAGALALVIATTTILAGCGSAGSAQAPSPAGKPAEASSGLVFASPELQFQMLRALGAAAYGAADTGECLEAASRVDEAECQAGDFSSWFDAWNSTAVRLRAVADECLARGNDISARDTYLRCNTYFSMAEFYLHGDPGDERIYETSADARECFSRAAKLMDPPAEEVKIRYEETTLPGYFYRVDKSGRKRPLLIMQTGFDGTQQELYAGGALAALERGYNVLTFEGPGQGEVLREQKLHFTKDWHKVVTRVIDYAVSRKDVDTNNISLWGISMGGCLTARAAAYEHRIKALILDPGMDISVLVTSSFGKGIAEMSGGAVQATKESLREAMEKSPDRIDEALGAMMKSSIQANWYIQNGMFAFGAKTPSEFLLAQLEYTTGDLAPKITAKTLVCDAEQDAAKFGTMTRDIYESLTCPKEYYMFTDAQGAGTHCQIGAFRAGAEVKLDFLDRATGKRH